MKGVLAMHARWGLFVLLVAASLSDFMLIPTRALAQAAVLTQHNDNARTGANLQETLLSASSVGPATFGKLSNRIVDAQVYAQPLYVPSLNIGGATRNVLFVATENNTVYAFDADDPASGSPLWVVNLGNATPHCAVFGPPTPPTCDPYLHNTIGITGTPVIDLPNGILYVVAATVDNPANPTVFKQALHALSIYTGSDVYPPVAIQASVPGTDESPSPCVAGSPGTVTFNPRWQLQRSALLLSSGNIYIAFTGHSDVCPYHGWLVGYTPTGGQLVPLPTAFNTTPGVPSGQLGGQGGIWHSGQGPAADSAGNVYVLTANGTFDAQSGGPDLSDSFVKLSPQLSVLDWFTPYNYAYQNGQDLDLGAGGPVLLPGSPVHLIGGGKEGILYFLNTQNLGHLQACPGGETGCSSAATDLSLQQVAQGIRGAPVTWELAGNQLLYVWGAQDGLRVLNAANPISSTPVAITPSIVNAPLQELLWHSQGWLASVGELGGFLSLSANGSQSGTGIVWATVAAGRDASHAIVPGLLRAYDASVPVVSGQIGTPTELWDSKLNGTRDDVGNLAKFVAPTIANGKVYVASSSDTAYQLNQVAVYGLYSSVTKPFFTLSASPSFGRLTPQAQTQFTVTVTALNGFAGAVGLSLNPSSLGLSLPPGVSGSFSPSQITGSGTSTLTLTTSSSVQQDTPLTIVAQSGALGQDTSICVDGNRDNSQTSPNADTNCAADADYDGDGRTDFTVWRPANGVGVWKTLDSRNRAPLTQVQWGFSTDVPLRGDFDGDGKADLAVWRPSNGTWYVVRSTTGASDYTGVQWGQQGDVPVPADYEGDGKTNFAVWRPSSGTWYVFPNGTGVAWGQAGDVPVPGDYNGDGKAEIAVWRPSNGTWYVYPSGQQVQWGLQGDIPVPADYQGIGTTQMAVYRPSNGCWYVYPSVSCIAQGLGTGGVQPGDIPVPGHFDGSVQAQYAIWRPNGGTWYYLPVGGGSPIAVQWGQSGDIPLLQPIL